MSTPTLLTCKVTVSFVTSIFGSTRVCKDPASLHADSSYGRLSESYLPIFSPTSGRYTSSIFCLSWSNTSLFFVCWLISRGSSSSSNNSSIISRFICRTSWLSSCVVNAVGINFEKKVIWRSRSPFIISHINRQYLAAFFCTSSSPSLSIRACA